MIWFAVPAVILGIVAIIASAADDEKTTAKKTKNNEKKKKYLNDVEKYRRSEKIRLEQKHKVCKKCIVFPSQFRISYNNRNFAYEKTERIEQIQKEIAYIDDILIKIKSQESQYVKSKTSK